MRFLTRPLFGLFLVVLFVAVWLGSTQNSAPVELRFLDLVSPSWPLSYWLVLAFALGFFAAVLLNSWSNLRLRLRTRRAEGEVRSVDKLEAKKDGVEAPRV